MLEDRVLEQEMELTTLKQHGGSIGCSSGINGREGAREESAGAGAEGEGGAMVPGTSSAGRGSQGGGSSREPRQFNGGGGGRGEGGG